MAEDVDADAYYADDDEQTDDIDLSFLDDDEKKD